jgi:hypothetical protein
LGDGSVRMLQEAIDHELYANLGTRDGNEAADLP